MSETLEVAGESKPAEPAQEPAGTKPRILERLKKARGLRVKPTDILIIAGFIVVVALLIVFLFNRLQLKRDVAAATIVTNQVINDLAKRDGTAARSLGTSKFKSTYTADALTKQFQAIELVTSEKPAIDQQIADSGKAGKTIAIVYKYPKKLADQPFYVAVTVSKHNGSSKWQLTNISGSADPSKLTL